uniref:Uncharacterized protein n=1 Tax=Rhizophora mucronata TaxID=61149 RepID=A0A2P2PWE7_RHIMU
MPSSNYVYTFLQQKDEKEKKRKIIPVTHF